MLEPTRFSRSKSPLAFLLALSAGVLLFQPSYLLSPVFAESLEPVTLKSQPASEQIGPSVESAPGGIILESGVLRIESAKPILRPRWQSWNGVANGKPAMFLKVDLSGIAPEDIASLKSSLESGVLGVVGNADKNPEAPDQILITQMLDVHALADAGLPQPKMLRIQLVFENRDAELKPVIGWLRDVPAHGATIKVFFIPPNDLQNVGETIPESSSKIAQAIAQVPSSTSNSAPASSPPVNSANIAQPTTSLSVVASEPEPLVQTTVANEDALKKISQLESSLVNVRKNLRVKEDELLEVKRQLLAEKNKPQAKTALKTAEVAKACPAAASPSAGLTADASTQMFLELQKKIQAVEKQRQALQQQNSTLVAQNNKLKAQIETNKSAEVKKPASNHIAANTTPQKPSIQKPEAKAYQLSQLSSVTASAIPQPKELPIDGLRLDPVKPLSDIQTEALEQEIRLYPDHWQAYFTLAAGYRQKQDWSSEERILNNLLLLDPKNPDGLKRLVDLYLYQQKYEAAQNSMDRLLKVYADASQLPADVASLQARLINARDVKAASN